MLGFVLVLAAWGSLLLRQPRWLSVLCTVAVLGVGTVLLLVGLLAAGLGDSASSGAAQWFTGALILLSRATLVTRIVLEALAAPNTPSP